MATIRVTRAVTAALVAGSSLGLALAGGVESTELGYAGLVIGCVLGAAAVFLPDADMLGSDIKKSLL
jgi:hypothetical protein